MECLFRFYNYGPERKFRPAIYKEFQTETLRDYDEGQLYGLEKFWAYLKYSRKKPEILKKYKRLEDFRVVSVSDFTIYWIKKWIYILNVLLLKTESATDGLIASETFAEQLRVWNAHIIVHVKQ